MKFPLFAVSLLALTAPAFANTKVISYVETNGAASSDPVVNFTSGVLAKLDSHGAINHAVAGIGTNKIYAKGNGTSELNGGSAWMDSYTVGGTGTINVHLSFTVDGISAVGANGGGDGNPFDWTYRVLALKGDNWNLGGQGFTATVSGSNLPIRSSGDNYESLLLTRTAPSDATVTNTYQPRFGGSTLWNVTNFGSEPGQFANGFARNGNNVTLTVLQNGVAVRQVFSQTRLQTFNNASGALISTTPYNAQNGLAQVYANLLASYPILAQTGLCTLDVDTGLCPGEQVYGPTTMNLNFTMQGGDKFTLLSYLSFINLRDGEFDFYNTAKLSGITVTGTNASISSGSGALKQLADGSFGYRPLTVTGVPEPASWALMIGGFGVIGGTARRRQRQAAKAASIAVGAPRNA